MSRILVLGAGIAGVSTAWHLAAGGAAVTVVDRGAEPASETSHANGCQISTQSGGPWMGPSGVREFLMTRLARERPIQLALARDPGRWNWFASALAASLPARYARAAAVTARLAGLSRETLDSLLSELNLDIALEPGGVLCLYRTRRRFGYACAHRRPGTEILSAGEILEHEPALGAARVRPVGAILYPGDATGDCYRFCVGLSESAAAAGVKFHFETPVHGLAMEKGRFRGVITESGTVEADHCVVALGPEVAPLLRRYGLRLPILPLRGYTLSAPIAAEAPAPGRLIDVERRIGCARIGNVFRAAGMADFAGPDLSAPARRLAELDRTAAEWYPPLAETQLTHWACLRPMTPDGPPILGATPIHGLWLNAGLGPLGWTLGCGAGRVVADLVLGRKPPLPLEGLGAERFI